MSDEEGEPPKRALLVLQAFPPLLKNAGGVAKRYLTLCRALIDDMGWQVTLLTPVNVTVSGEPDVDRWLSEGSLEHLAARGVRCYSSDGVVVFLDLFSFVNTGYLLQGLFYDRQTGHFTLSKSRYDLCIADDVPFRISLLLLARAAGVPTVITSHTDATHLSTYKGFLPIIWHLHIRCAHLASVHASVSRVFGESMVSRYNTPVQATWPPILWAKEFKSPPEEWQEPAAKLRDSWLKQIAAQGGPSPPTAILLFAGRWSAEKRISLLYDVVPEGAALVIVGDGTSVVADSVAAAGPQSNRPWVLSQRKMLNGAELRVAYTAADLFCSASNFETLGNTLIEAWCSGTPCAVQPAQGHLEFTKHEQNGWFVNYDDPVAAKAVLSSIVDGGLRGSPLDKALPELRSLGERFRTQDFAAEIDQAVLQPALRIRRRQVRCGVIDYPVRVLALLIYVTTWLLLRIINRTIFAISRDPRFEVISTLGGSIEANSADPRTPPRSQPPKRILNTAKKIMPRKMPTANTATADDTDFVSHYAGAQVARRSWAMTL